MTYKDKAKQVRKEVLKLRHRAETCHIGSDLSAVDLAVVLYENLRESDTCVWSAGWKSALKYVINGEDTSNFPINPPALMENMGSAGHGLPMSVGMAMARRQDTSQLGENDEWPEASRLFVIMSEGEIQCGTTWESMMIASKYRLNITVLLDLNGWQSLGKPEDILPLEPIEDKVNAFGWDALRIDGHNYNDLEKAIQHRPDGPLFIICETTKGKGVDFMEDDFTWHYKNLNDEQLEKAILQQS